MPPTNGPVTLAFGTLSGECPNPPWTLYGHIEERTFPLSTPRRSLRESLTISLPPSLQQSPLPSPPEAATATESNERLPREIGNGGRNPQEL